MARSSTVVQVYMLKNCTVFFFSLYKSNIINHYQNTLFILISQKKKKSFKNNLDTMV